MKKIILLMMGIVLVAGCTSPKFYPAYFAGTYVNQPKPGEPGTYSLTCNRNYAYCFQKVQDIIKSTNGEVCYSNKGGHQIVTLGFNKIFHNAINTTKVTINFKEIGPDKTEIVIACGNYDLSEFVTDKISKGLKENQQVKK